MTPCSRAQSVKYRYAVLRQHREPTNRSSNGGAVAADWAIQNPRSEALSVRARRLLPGGVAHDVRLAEPFPLAVARAAGSRKWDLDGHELVCYVMGHGSLLAGHCHPEVVAAVRDQAARSFHPGACHELESDWGEAVIGLVPSAERVRFTSSGAEASLLALRVAPAVTAPGQVVKLAGRFTRRPDQAGRRAAPPFARPRPAGPLSGAGGVERLAGVGSGEAQQQAAGLAAELREELSSVFERCGVAGRAYGESSVFQLLFGPEAPEQRAPATLKAGLPRPLSSALHCGMLREGVHLFHGSGFLSTAHSQSDLERTADALAVTLPLMAAEGLV